MSHPHQIPCPELARGCGGCDLGTQALADQHQIKLDRVSARLGDGPIELMPLDPWGWRTTVRAAVVNGQAGYRRAKSHDVVVVEGCPIAHPVVEDLLVNGRFEGCTEVVIRVGANTGDAMVVAAPNAEQVDLSAVTLVQADQIRLVGSDQLTAGKRSWIFEELADRRWRVSAQSFFQARPDGAEALVKVASDEIARMVGRPDHLVDLYSGVGLFAGSIPASRVTAVENNRSSCADARVNLADLAEGTTAKVVISDVARWHGARADAVVADPSRRGLGSGGVRVIDRTKASAVVLVSCDIEAAARDRASLATKGFKVERTTLVDMFAHSSHVELVTSLSR